MASKLGDNIDEHLFKPCDQRASSNPCTDRASKESKMDPQEAIDEIAKSNR